MPFRYDIFEESCFEKDLGVYQTYGIRLLKMTKTKAQVVAEYHDVFLEKETALHFVHLCNTEQLAPVHFLDALEDFLP